MSNDANTLAGSAIAIATLEILYKSKALTLDQCRDVINLASRNVGQSIPHDKTGTAIEAQRIVNSYLTHQFRKS